MKKLCAGSFLFLAALFLLPVREIAASDTECSPDITNPDLTVPADTTVECGDSTDPFDTGEATATDFCDTSPEISYSDSESFGCGDTKTITRTWTATDDAFNEANGDQTITVVDTTDPDITIPLDTTVECGDSTDPASTGEATGSDDCGSVTINYSDNFTLNCGGDGTITRTWTATDDCGNFVTGDQFITVQDTTDPGITVPLDTTVECGDATDPSSTGEATGNDGCGSVTIDYGDNFTPGCGSAGTITRTWSATDDCGNFTTGDQIITVQDTTNPDITVPLDTTVECGDSTDPVDTGDATGSDGCGGVTIGYSDDFSGSCGTAGTISRLWNATDDCGNQSFGTQYITIEDTTPPDITLPSDVTLECTDSTDPSSTGEATGSDGCGGVTISHDDSDQPTCMVSPRGPRPLVALANARIISRVWTGTDDCGNSAVATQTLTVVDTGAPTVSPPADTTVECGGSTDPFDTGTATASDSCDFSLVITYSDNEVTGCGSTKVITRTWRAEDDCGNAGTADQIITVQDTTNPDITAPSDTTVECGDDTSPMSNGEATGSDACGSVSISYDDSDQPTCTVSPRGPRPLVAPSGARVISRVWTGTDDCGNSAMVTQTVTVVDTAAPSVTPPADTTVECGGSTDPFDTGTATASDSCDFSLLITYSDDEVTGCSSTKVITRTWRAEDDCGNAGTADQIITVSDTTDPEVTPPADVSVACGDSIDPGDTGYASATDNCTGSPSISYSDYNVGGSPGVADTIVRTWDAEDDCSNIGSSVQTITVLDADAPIVTLLGAADLTNECHAAFADPGVTASDACSGDLTSTVFTNTLFDADTPGVYTLTYEAVDEASNTGTATRTVTVEDSTQPVVTLLGVNPQTIALNDAYVESGATATDTCFGSLSAQIATNGSVDVGAEGTYLVTFTAGDSEGNVGTAVRAVYVVGTNLIVNQIVPGGATPRVYFGADVGNAYDVFATTNFIDWINIGTATPTPGSPGVFQFDDPDATNMPNRNYSLRMQDPPP